jgi:hypothetical protein
LTVIPVSVWKRLMNVSRNGAIALSWKLPMVIVPVPLAGEPAAAVLLLGTLFEPPPPQAASTLPPSSVVAPAAPRLRTCLRL